MDTLKIADELRRSGFTQEQAEGQARVLYQFASGELATKRDVKEVESALKRDIKELETSLKRDIREVEAGSKRDLGEMALKMEKIHAETKLWLFATSLALAGFFLATMRFLK